MTPEEYQRFKEAEKEHLRKLKQLKEQARQLRRRASVNQALDNMVGDVERAASVHEEMVDKLAMEAARHEARLEIALENAAEREEASVDEPSKSTEELEEELTKARARTLLEQMKLQMGMAPPEADAPPPTKTLSKHAAREQHPNAPEKSSQQAASKPDEPSDRPEKTIGRMK